MFRLGVAPRTEDDAASTRGHGMNTMTDGGTSPARKMTAALLAATVVAAALWASTPAGASTTGATCVWEDTIEQTYGLTMEPHDSNFHSTGDGWIECHGIINGIAVSGRGPFRHVGRAFGTWCGAGTGWARATASVPTVDGGTMQLTGTVDWVRAGLNGAYIGELSGSRVAGDFVAQPREGDCRNSPVTVVTLRSAVTIS